MEQCQLTPTQFPTPAATAWSMHKLPKEMQDRLHGCSKRTCNDCDLLRQICLHRRDVSPNFPPLKSRVLGCRHALGDGVSLFGRAVFLRSSRLRLQAKRCFLFGLRHRFLVPASARQARRAEIGSRRTAGPRVAAHSGLDAIEHDARLGRGWASSLPDHGPFRGHPA